jgi:hypothetical protein
VVTTRTEGGHGQNTKTVTKTVATTRTEDGHRQNTKTVTITVATTLTEGGHRQNTKTSNAIQTDIKKEHRETEDEIKDPTSSSGLRNRLTRLNLHEHDELMNLSLQTSTFIPISL